MNNEQIKKVVIPMIDLVIGEVFDAKRFIFNSLVPENTLGNKWNHTNTIPLYLTDVDGDTVDKAVFRVDFNVQENIERIQEIIEQVNDLVNGFDFKDCDLEFEEFNGVLSLDVVDSHGNIIDGIEF